MGSVASINHKLGPSCAGREWPSGESVVSRSGGIVCSPDGNGSSFPWSGGIVVVEVKRLSGKLCGGRTMRSAKAGMQ